MAKNMREKTHKIKGDTKDIEAVKFADELPIWKREKK